MADAGSGTVVRYIRGLAAFRATEEMTDRQLLEGFLARGDEQCFATLVKRHGPLVLAVCRRVLSHQQDAEDAFQATFLVLAQNAASIRKTDSLAAWLHGVAYRLALKTKRDAARRRSHEREVRALPRIPKNSEDPSTSQLQNFAEVQVILDEEIQRMPEKYRGVFALCCLEGQSRAEVAKELGLKEGTVRGRLSQARKRLQQRLARRGVTLSALLGAAAISESATRAAVPSALAATTLRSALLFVERCNSGVTAAASGFVSPKVIALAQGAHKAFYVTKGKTLAALLLAVGLAAAGAGVLAQRDRVTLPTQAQATSPQVEKPRPPKLIPQKRARLDQYGDPLPEGATARLGTMRWRHGYLISSFVFSPDSKTLVSGGEDSIIRIWDATTGKELRRLAGHRDGVYGMVLSGDGKTLFSGGGDGTVRVWEMATGKELRQLVGHKGPVLAVTISPDGKTIASGGSDKAIRLWNVVDGKPVHHLVAHQLEVASLVFSPDGKMLASASAPWLRIVPSEKQDSKIRLWSVATGKEIGQLVGHKQGICAIVFSPDGKMLVSAGDYHALGDRAIRLWHVATRAEMQRWEPKEAETFHSLALSPDGKILAVGTSTSLQNPNLAAGLADMEYKVRLWDVRTGKVLREIHAGDDRCVAFSPDGKILAFLSADRTLQMWDLATQSPIRNFKGHEANVMSVIFSADGKTLASAGIDKTIRLWDVTTAREVGQLHGHKQAIHRLALSPDSKTLASGSYDHTFRLWDLPARKEIACEFQAQEVLGVGFSPDGKLVASAGAAGGFLLKELAPRMKLTNQRQAGVALASLVWAPDGKVIATGTGDGRILLWDGTTGVKLREWKGHENTIRDLALSSDGKTLASASEDGRISLWEISSGKERRRLRHPEIVSCVTFSPIGDLLLSGSQSMKDQAIHIWDLAQDKELAPLTGHQAGINSLSFSSDGSRLASGSNDTTILLWDIAIMKKQRPRIPRLSAKELDILWQDLSGEDASKAYLAIWTLASGRQDTVAFLKQRLRPIQQADPQRVAKLIANLGSSEFVERQKATAELGELGESASPALRHALENRPDPEVRRRLQSLLELIQGPITSPETLRNLRAIEVLEHIGSAEAKQVLKSVAQGPPEARLTQHAKASLDRLTKRPATTP